MRRQTPSLLLRARRRVQGAVSWGNSRLTAKTRCWRHLCQPSVRHPWAQQNHRVVTQDMAAPRHEDGAIRAVDLDQALRLRVRVLDDIAAEAPAPPRDRSGRQGYAGPTPFVTTFPRLRVFAPCDPKQGACHLRALHRPAQAAGGHPRQTRAEIIRLVIFQAAG